MGKSEGIIAKTHAKAAGKTVKRILALCDAELLGKVFTQGDTALDLKNYRSFYEGVKVSEDEAIELLKNAENANVVGEQSVKAAQKALKLPKTAVKKIGGIPHLQYYKI